MVRPKNIDQTRKEALIRARYKCEWHSDIFTGKQQVSSRREYIKLVQEYLELKRNNK